MANNPFLRSPKPTASAAYCIGWLNSKIPKHWNREQTIEFVNKVFDLRDAINATGQ